MSCKGCDHAACLDDGWYCDYLNIHLRAPDLEGAARVYEYIGRTLNDMRKAV